MIKAAISKKKGKGFDKLRKYLKELSGESVSVGYFSDQGTYPSKKNTQNWSYAQLMAYHELFADQNGVQLRPIFGDVSRRDVAKIRKNVREIYAKQLVGSYKGNKTASPKRTLNLSGQFLASLVKRRFGMRSLPRNLPSTIQKKGFNAPMIETGKLRDSLSYKNTIENKRYTFRGEAFK